MWTWTHMFLWQLQVIICNAARLIIPYSFTNGRELGTGLFFKQHAKNVKVFLLYVRDIRETLLFSDMSTNMWHPPTSSKNWFVTLFFLYFFVCILRNHNFARKKKHISVVARVSPPPPGPFLDMTANNIFFFLRPFRIILIIIWIVGR